MPGRKTGFQCCGGIFAEFSAESVICRADGLLHIFREGACKDQFSAGTGVTEGQACGMQCLPLHAEPLVIFRR